MMLRAEVLCSESLKQHVVDCKQKQKHLKLFDWHFSLSTFQKKQKKMGAARTFRGGSQVFKKMLDFSLCTLNVQFVLTASVFQHKNP